MFITQSSLEYTYTQAIQNHLLPPTSKMKVNGHWTSLFAPTMRLGHFPLKHRPRTRVPLDRKRRPRLRVRDHGGGGTELGHRVLQVLADLGRLVPDPWFGPGPLV